MSNANMAAGASVHRGRSAALWLTMLTAALVLAGFRPQRFSSPYQPRDSEGAKPHTGSEHGRGRDASSPAEMPAAGWKDIALRVYGNMGNDRVVALAAGVTFYSILALFPAIAALVGLYGLFADPSRIATHLALLSDVMPGGGVQVLGDEMKRIATQGNNALGLAFVVGLATALWSANAGLKSLFDALNLVYKEPEKRGFIKLNAVSLAFTTATICFLLLALGAMVVLPMALSYFGMGDVGTLAAKIARWPILLIVLIFGLACLYRFGPSRAPAKWRWVTWGSFAAALVWVVASLLFTWYAANFGNYNATYGSLGAIIGFMIWIWISVIVILLGAELNAEAEHQSARDTTTGAPRPRGARRAAMADTVGARQ